MSEFDPSNPQETGAGVSHQFTDAERSLDERITEHLTAPPIDAMIGDTAGQTYKWLSADMAQRSTMTKELAGEESLANAQSQRQALAAQGDFQKQQDVEAADGMRHINSLANPGAGGTPMSFADAQAQAVKANPNLLANPVFGRLSETATKISAQPELDRVTKLRQAIDLTELNTRQLTATAANYYARNHPDEVKTIATGQFTTALAEANRATLSQAADALEASRRVDMINASLPGFSPDAAKYNAQSERLVHIAGAFADAGLQGVTAPHRLVVDYGESPSIMSMLMDKGWLDSLGAPGNGNNDKLPTIGGISPIVNNEPNKDNYKAALITTLNKLTATSKDGNSIIDDDSNKARTELFHLAALHDSQNAEAKEANETTKAHVSLEGTAMKAMDDIIKSGTKSGSALADDTRAIADKKQQILSIARGFIQSSHELGKNSNNQDILENYSGWLDELDRRVSDGHHESTTPAEVAGMAHDLMIHYAQAVFSRAHGKDIKLVVPNSGKKADETGDPPPSKTPPVPATTTPTSDTTTSNAPPPTSQEGNSAPAHREGDERPFTDKDGKVTMGVWRTVKNEGAWYPK